MLACEAQAQTTNVTTSGTNITTTVPQFLTTSYNALIGSGITNLDMTVGASYTPGSKTWGEFLMLHRNLSIGGGSFVAPGIGVEQYGGSWYSLQLQTSLGVDVTPLSGWTNMLGKTLGGLVFTPYTTVGAETPFSGQGSATMGAFVSAGGTVHLLTIPYLKADFGLGGGVGTRTGLSSAGLNGKFYNVFANFLWRF